jgi:molybdate/tungstate transport system substrate-binding protein
MIRHALLSLVLVLSLGGCQNRSENSGTAELIVFHAGSLSIPMRDIAAAFEAQNPGVKVIRESSGSRAAARKIADLGRGCDVMASADYTVIDELLMGKHATWNLIFATNEMVLAYPNSLPPGQVPGLDNWHLLLAAEGARVGHADPNSDPCGYRALMVMQLAELESGAEGLMANIKMNTVGHVRPKASDLLALLEVGELDYAFLYRSVASQHKVPFLELPPSINLGDPARADDYAVATVDVSGPKPGTYIKKVGSPVAYGVTIPANSPHPELALDFVEFLVQEQHGLKILEHNGQASLVPSPNESYDKLPERLRAHASPSK